MLQFDLAPSEYGIAAYTYEVAAERRTICSKRRSSSYTGSSSPSPCSARSALTNNNAQLRMASHRQLVTYHGHRQQRYFCCRHRGSWGASSEVLAFCLGILPGLSGKACSAVTLKTFDRQFYNRQHPTPLQEIFGPRFVYASRPTLCCPCSHIAIRWHDVVQSEFLRSSTNSSPCTL